MAKVKPKVYGVYSRTQQFSCCGVGTCDRPHAHEMIKELNEFGFKAELLEWESRPIYVRQPDGKYVMVSAVTVMFRTLVSYVPRARLTGAKDERYNPDLSLVSLGCVSRDADAAFSWKCRWSEFGSCVRVIPPTLYLVREVRDSGKPSPSTSSYVTRVDRLNSFEGIETKNDLWDLLEQETALDVPRSLFEQMCPVSKVPGLHAAAYHMWPVPEHHRRTSIEFPCASAELRQYRFACVSLLSRTSKSFVPYDPQVISKVTLDLSRSVAACGSQRDRILGEHSSSDLILEPVGKVVLEKA